MEKIRLSKEEFSQMIKNKEFIFGKAGIGATAIYKDFNTGSAEVLTTLYDICHPDHKPYFMNKYVEVPHVEEIIDILQSEDIAPRDIDLVLDCIKCNIGKTLVQIKIGNNLASHIYSVLHPYESGKHSYKEEK